MPSCCPGRPHDEWELARRIVPNWDDGNASETLAALLRFWSRFVWVCVCYLLTLPSLFAAPSDVRQAYKQFIGAVVELLNGEVASEELRQVAQAVYRLFAAESDAADKPLLKRYTAAVL